MKATIEQIRKAQKPGGSYFTIISSRKLSPYFTWVLLRLNAGPNLITFISLLFIIFGAYFFTFPAPLYWILGRVILQMYHILDCCDGEVAKAKRSLSKFGGMFDSILHPLGNSIVFAAASIGIYNLTNNVLFLYLGFVTTILLLMHTIVRLHGAILVGKEKKYALGNYTDRKTTRGRLLAVFTEVGGPANMLVLVALFDFITGLNFRIYFLALFTIGIFILLVKKTLGIKQDLEK